MIIVSPLLCRALSVVVSVSGFTLWPVMVFASEPDPVTENHERIHLRQQVELLVIGFLVAYVIEWLWRVVRGASGEGAYDASIFEAEAYAHETDPGYLQRRRPYAWARR